MKTIAHIVHTGKQKGARCNEFLQKNRLNCCFVIKYTFEATYNNVGHLVSQNSQRYAMKLRDVPLPYYHPV